ncbi:LysM peptidoglycan-binding domain-containing protein [Leuconostoc fallax]|uniref:LysM peptidoglycan-binding domain-containing protein n=1 Tax=Leuconostoc fallax TaxID=1251 RepID=UPI0020906BAA|nr:LysM peptidoglycan-binding domain-containing protein [Leuconostoc fallax]MCO6184308.1 LysM peptidoglycan-binding domain-containing protein [Leuconostoc fallax]
MFNNTKKTLAVAAGFAGALAFGATNASADTTYTIKSGDTLNKIAANFNTSVDDIASANSVKDINFIYVGEQLTIGGSSKAVEAPKAQVQEQTVQTQPQAQTQVAAAPQQAPQVQVETPRATTSSSNNSSALNELISRESSGNVNATNGSYYGIGQLSPQARATYGGNSTDYNDQLNAMKSYISARYGSADAALAHHNATGWY